MKSEVRTKANPRPTETAAHRAPARTALRTSVALLLAAGTTLHAQDAGEASAADLAYRVQNRLAFIPRLPIENQFDFGYGSEDAMRYAFRPRPVVPFSLGENLSLITRTTFNLIYQEAPEAGLDDKFGLGDTDLEMYFSPKYTKAGGWIYGAGPMVRFPTATDDALGGEKWGIGPAAAAMRQSGRWTYGVFMNHLWDFAGEDARADLNATYLQPVLSYTTTGATTFGVDTQATYDWTNEEWTVPINATVSQLVKIGGQPIAFTLGGRYYADSPAGGPEWGFQFSMNLLFAK